MDSGIFFNRNGMYYYKDNKDDKIWWVEYDDEEKNLDGDMLFTFDTYKIYNLFSDYPHALTSEQKAIFDKENPYWADFFKDRS